MSYPSSPPSPSSPSPPSSTSVLSPLAPQSTPGPPQVFNLPVLPANQDVRPLDGQSLAKLESSSTHFRQPDKFYTPVHSPGTESLVHQGLSQFSFNMGTNVPLQPTFHGHVATTFDALLLFEACLSGILPHVPRRPHDRERQDLIRSGNVFIYEEQSSGIKRWTDGVSWSPSRILGNHLLYRELHQPFPPGEKKRAAKKPKRTNGGITKPDSSAPRHNLANSSVANHAAATVDDSSNNSSQEARKNAERALVGSLVDSYAFKEGGLVKKTISISYRGVPHHLVSYYTVDDVLEGRLIPPSEAEMLSGIFPRADLLMSQNFRAPMEELKCDERLVQRLMAAQMGALPSSQFIMQPRSLSVPSTHHMGENRQWVAATFPQQQHYMQPPYQNTVPSSISHPSFGPEQLQHNVYGFGDPTHCRLVHEVEASPEAARNMSMDSVPRRHSTYDMVQAGQAPRFGPGLPNMADDEARHFNENPFLQGAAALNPADRIPETVSQAPDGFPSPQTVTQAESSLIANTDPPAPKLEGDDPQEPDTSSWAALTALDDDQDHFISGAHLDQNQQYGMDAGSDGGFGDQAWQGAIRRE